MSQATTNAKILQGARIAAALDKLVETLSASTVDPGVMYSVWHSYTDGGWKWASERQWPDERPLPRA